MTDAEIAAIIEAWVAECREATMKGRPSNGRSRRGALSPDTRMAPTLERVGASLSSRLKPGAG